jgi:predicted nucleic acid-binding protein
MAINPDLIIDTQILSYLFKGSAADNSRAASAISSITANEFLLTNAKPSRRPEYFVVNPVYVGGAHLSARTIFDHPKWPERANWLTDEMIIDFNGEFQPYREFGSLAIAKVINERLQLVYSLSISRLSKTKQKLLKERFEYILQQGLVCYAVDETTLKIGMDLFQRFLEKHTPKADIRNTVNDMLILSTAIRHKKQIATADKLLNRFVAEVYNVPIREGADGIVIDFSIVPAVRRRRGSESKGYLNRGWRFMIEKRGTLNSG